MWIKFGARVLINLGYVLLGVIAAKELVDAGNELYREIQPPQLEA